ncbi:RNA-directed DNA polymerase [Sinorhizobium kummerowiae]|uniref:RNA-directed DNA polymerase n=1 Tax=Sinorhizobium kummerowiae TaxID=158892 RepID=A0ABY8TAH5_9HYPH|nr:RNA-directed DNA polymerase [Sinorhizobium kummerowiae]WHS94254.1 RNA-directed DNA polymerase [Sinorhizobium kummerowiae]WRW46185.1 RNA-directed DNA polymerase [Sinorhizobium kummerowiae]
MDDKPSAQRFIDQGILPENLPPIFTTSKLWQHFSGSGTAYGITGKAVGDHAVYNASKRGGQRRVFSLPHPAFVRDLGLFYEKHWEDLRPLLERAPGSVSKPIFTPTGNRHVRITPHSELPELRLRAFSRFKYCLVTDIARFFPSIYTHTFPWAINGKSAAKGDTSSNSAAVFGNRLDFIFRNSQSRQTIGIPVGPDASKIASELLLSAVDNDFLSRYPITGRPTYVRHVDDYWIAGNSQEECERHLFHLRLALREFQLDINESKTKIISTKLVFADDWPFEFDRELIDSLEGGRKHRNETLSILAKITEVAATSGDDGLIRHAIRLIDENRLWDTNWSLLEHFVAQCAVQFPHSFDYVARVVAWRKRINPSTLDAELWRHVALATIEQNAPLGRDSEVVWALWLLRELEVVLPRATTDLMLVNAGPIPLALLAHMSVNKLTADRRLRDKLIKKVRGNPIAGPLWPLSLELTHLGKAEPSWLQEKLPAYLLVLHQKRASIIDWQAKPKVFDDTPDGEDDGPEYAIEDYGADYGSDENAAAEDDDEEDEDGNFDDPIHDLLDDEFDEAMRREDERDRRGEPDEEDDI